MSARLGSVLLALVLACGGEQPGPASAVEVPDPVTPDMVAPVARALSEARGAVVASPESAAAWGRYGQVLHAHELHDEAAACYRRARAIDPREFRWAYLLAVVEDLRGSELAAVDGAFRAAFAVHADYVAGHFRHGDALVRQGAVEEARVAFERALELDPDFRPARRALGQVLVRLGRLDEGIAALERAAAQDDQDALVHGALAQAWRLAGDPARAARAAERAAGLEPDRTLPDELTGVVDQLDASPEACHERAEARYAAGDHGAALPDLHRLEEVYPENATYQLRLGVSYARTARPAEAERHLLRAVELAPGQVTAHLQLAGLYEDAGRMDRAVEHCRRALAAEPRNLVLHKKLGLALAVSGDLPGAVAAFRAAVELGLTDAELFHNLGTAEHRAGDAASAAGSFERALALDPENPATLYNLGLALEDLERLEEALDCYRRAAARVPEHPAAARLAELEGRR